jgi:hypothetical protein
MLLARRPQERMTSKSPYPSKWLCLDCAKDLSVPGGDYYILRNKLWREIVPRKQRHGMLCLNCVQGRLGRELAPEDFNREPYDTFEQDDPINGSMSLDDYGILDDLRVPGITPVDQYLMDQVLSDSKKIRTVIIAALGDTSGSMPQVSDCFYAERIEFLLATGALEMAGEAKEFMDIRIVSARAK